MSKIEQFITFITKLFVFLLSAIFLSFIAIEVSRDEIILEPLNVPDELIKKGYTGEIIAEKLLDQVRRIELTTRDLANTIHFEDKSYFNNAKNLITNIRFVDIEIPGTNFTHLSLVRYLRNILRTKGTTYLRGDVILEENRVTLILRNISNASIPSISVSTDSGDIEKLIQDRGGKALIQMTNPTLLVMKSFLDYSNLRLDNVKEYQSALTELEDVISYCLMHSSTNVADRTNGCLF